MAKRVMSRLATTSQRTSCAVFTKEQIVVVLNDTADAAAGWAPLDALIVCFTSLRRHPVRKCLGAHTAIKGRQQQEQKSAAKAAWGSRAAGTQQAVIRPTCRAAAYLAPAPADP
ncbi:hypothetical protein HaLaN_07470 [Haematococcus lacustris]|uniref:Uncharacterized protein n=1 Tax=Haematococcus lacustris TaxID=44745 RepID=A0A699Z8N1_HAELA|nr:hypothetical protein HaLaN_07470 [Haematococcus lacustris]